MSATSTRTLRRHRGLSRCGQLVRSLGAAIGILIALFAAQPEAHAQATDALFAQGNDDYIKGRYQEAARAYTELVEQHQVSDPTLFHNLGNAHFKSGQYGRAILYYRRAIAGAGGQLKQAVERNLDATRRTLQSRYRSDADGSQFIYAEPGGFLHKVTHVLSPTALAIVFAALWTLWLAVLIAKRVTNAGGWGRAALPLGILAVIFGALLWGQMYLDGNSVRGVVVAADAKVRVARHESAEGKMLPEGMEVLIVDQSDDWTQVELATGGRGWVESSAVEQI